MFPVNRQWLFGVSLTGAMIACTTLARGQEKDKEKRDATEKVTLQYRVSKDAFAPSKFVAVIGGGISQPLNVSWDLPNLKDKDKKAVHERHKKEFDDLIKKLEANEVNGVEFECRGEWLKKGFRLRITSVPQPTEAGKKTIKDAGRWTDRRTRRRTCCGGITAARGSGPHRPPQQASGVVRSAAWGCASGGTRVC